jgi:hypothetical protein
MSTLSFSRELPLDDSWDVIVVGGGPSGTLAAAAAAREGARTLLLEASGSLGGMGTGGLVPAWMTFGDGEKMIVRGLAQRVFYESCACSPDAHPEWFGGPIEPEGLKRIYDNLVTETGVNVLFNTMYAGAETDGAGVVTSILAVNKAGITAYKAKVYVDATGDGDLSVAAGAGFTQGDAQTGEIMPVTLCFILANVDSYNYQFGPRMWPATIKTILDSGEFPEIPDMHFCNNFIGPGTVGFNAGHLWEVDNTDPVAVSQAMIDGRKIALAFRNALAKYHPAFANAYLVSTGSLLGARETRRIIGDYVLTVGDFFARRTFPDDICRNAYPIDIHTAKNEIAASRAGQLDVMARYEHFQPGESHGIPYRCLTPKGVRNVLVTGRAVSCDRPVQAAIRVMSACLGMGEAAGLAAALAAAGDGDVHAVDTNRLRARLIEEGGYLPEAVEA